MAIFANLTQYLSLAADDFSDHIVSCTLQEMYDELDKTNFGSSGNREYVAGLHDADVTIDFLDDYAASQVWAFWNTNKGTAVAFEWRPTSSSVGATNPKATGNLLVSKMPRGGKVGDLATVSVTWKVTGAVTWATS